ncbi:MAG: ATP phosphoribosyltransferase [Planctomycetota bacterium]
MLLKLALPKGSLQETTFDLFEKAGWKLRNSGRSYFPMIDDEEIQIVLVRAQEIAHYVEEGVMDAGITGLDWVRETEANVQVVCDLVYAKQGMTPVRWVLAVPEESDIRCVRDLAGKRIATELVNCTRRWLRENGVEASVEFSWGATEMKTPLLVDAIVEVTETGSSLRAHKLRIVDTLMQSVTQMVANVDSWADRAKREKMEAIALLLQAAIRARDKVGLKMNVAAGSLESVLRELPALKRPTVSPLSEKDWFAVDTIVDESIVRRIVPNLKKAGAEGIVEYPLNKVIP